jgi:hypothetical protein
LNPYTEAENRKPAPTPTANDKGSANDKGRQVGGTHYRKQQERGVQQHWDRAWDLYREAWFVLNITKYVERYRDKGGIDDLKKARHYLDKLIELEESAHSLEESTAARNVPPEAPPQPIEETKQGAAAREWRCEDCRGTGRKLLDEVRLDGTPTGFKLNYEDGKTCPSCAGKGRIVPPEYDPKEYE